jgi:hypothetical protein
MTVSVRVAHSKKCANASKTSLNSVGRGSGCTCQPSYYTFHRRDITLGGGPGVPPYPRPAPIYARRPSSPSWPEAKLGRGFTYRRMTPSLSVKS